jgi:hypothetical protein
VRLKAQKRKSIGSSIPPPLHIQNHNYTAKYNLKCQRKFNVIADAFCVLAKEDASLG